MVRGQRLLALLLSVLALIALRFAVVAAAVSMPTIDGDPKNIEWDGTYKVLLFSTMAQSGNRTSFAYFYCLPDFEKGRAAFAFSVIGDDCTPGSSAGIRVILEGLGALHFGFSDPENPTYNGELLHIRSAMIARGNTGLGEEFTAEAMVDLKRAFPAKLVITVQILDAVGEPSRPFSFTLENENAPAFTTSPPALTTAHPPVSTTKVPKTRPSNTSKSKSSNGTTSAISKNISGITTPSLIIPSSNDDSASLTNQSAVPYTKKYIPNAAYGGNAQQHEEDTFEITDWEEDTSSILFAPIDDSTLFNDDANNGSGRGFLRIAAFAVAFALLIAAAVVGIIRKPKSGADSDD
ncbi:MAG: hypothetical protein LBJ12_07470 [Oscillospiraceae bacterium]|nr:hypothetical protein [Oscillospiraceae bacterium]